ncbi:MAG: NIPSNAP family protein [Blastocatellia bacterium]
MIQLRVTYRLRAHHTAAFEQIFQREILPVVHDHGLQFRGIWRTHTGNVGEYMEIWEFWSMTEYAERWPKLINDPRIQKIFERTGPMVEDENWTLLEPVLNAQAPGSRDAD